MVSIYAFLAPVVLLIFWILAFLKLFSQEGGIAFFLKHFLSATALFVGLMWGLFANGSENLEGFGNLIILTPLIAFIYFAWSVYVFYKSIHFGKNQNESIEGILDDNLKS